LTLQGEQVGKQIVQFLEVEQLLDPLLAFVPIDHLGLKNQQQQVHRFFDLLVRGTRLAKLLVHFANLACRLDHSLVVGLVIKVLVRRAGNVLEERAENRGSIVRHGWQSPDTMDSNVILTSLLV
jgi:hypothetical protein